MYKSIIKKSSIYSFIITLLGCLVNLISIKIFNIVPPLALTIPGGDCIDYIGFGIDALKVFPLTDDPSSISVQQIYVSFNIMSFISSFIILFLIFLIILIIKNKLINKKINN